MEYFPHERKMQNWRKNVPSIKIGAFLCHYIYVISSALHNKVKHTDTYKQQNKTRDETEGKELVEQLVS